MREGITNQPTRPLLLRFLLPWMVLHCIVIAFLALGAAILTAHDRALLGWIALIGRSTSMLSLRLPDLASFLGAGVARRREARNP